MAERPLRSVSELVGAVKLALDEGFGTVRVRGEISGLKRAGSGHVYFILKDASAQLRAVLFRGAAVTLRFLPADGLDVEVEGDLTVYEPRGDLQLIVRRMVPSGVGALMQAFLRLRNRLAGEGLFDEARKRPLPRFPCTIAVVTSPSGAAVRDVLHVLARRWPVARVVIVPVRVQGEGAAEEIAAALDRVGRWGGADVVIVGRGGGSLEDLWAFNEEIVARAIVACRVPVVSAVGHETDVTIADFAADARGATPTAAAVLVTPDGDEVLSTFLRARDRMVRRLVERIRGERGRIDRLAAAYGLRRPEDFLRREMQRVDRLAFRLETRMASGLAGVRGRVERSARGLAAQHPRARVEAARREIDHRGERLRAAEAGRLRAARQTVAGTARALEALDPTRVLDRGYCVARDGAAGRFITGIEGLDPGSGLVVQFGRGRASTRVVGTEPGRLAEIEAEEHRA